MKSKIISLHHTGNYWNVKAKRLSVNILLTILLLSFSFCNIENPQSKNNQRNFSVFVSLVYNEKSSIITTRVGSMNNAHSSPKAILLDNDKVLVIGNGAELFDPSTLSFSVVANRTTNRVRHTLTKLQDGRVLISGGNLTTVEIYNPITATFSNTGTMIQSLRSSNTATLLLNGKVLVTGGAQASAPTTSFITAELYDPNTGLFTATGNMNYARRGHNATLLDDGTVLIVGGYDSQDNILSSVEVYNPATGVFTMINNSLCQFTSGYSGENSVLLSNNNVFLANNGYPAGLQIFDKTTGNCSLSQLSLRGIGNFSIAPLKDGRILLVGGATVTNYVSELNVYNPDSDTITYLGNMSVARSYTLNIVLNDGRVLITRGSPPSNAKITEIYTP